MPKSITALGGKYYVKDNRDTPDTLMVTYEYPKGFVATFEAMSGTSQSPYPNGAGALFCGTKGRLFVSRSVAQIEPENGSDVEVQAIKPSNNMNMAHWANFIECIKTREKPISDVETCFKTTAVCQLANASYRSKLRLDWDDAKPATEQKEVRPYLMYEYRKPWKLVV